MDYGFVLPAWITVLIILVVYFTILLLKARSTKRGFNRSNIIASVTESIGAVLAAELAIRMLYQAALVKQDLSLVQYANKRDYIYIGMYFLALFVDFIRVNWRRWKRARSR